MAKRSASQHDEDTRKTIAGRDPAWLHAYIARLALRMVVADKELGKQKAPRLLSPSMLAALRTFRPLSEADTGRKSPWPDKDEADAG